jgi:hypothetical protein
LITLVYEANPRRSSFILAALSGLVLAAFGGAGQCPRAGGEAALPIGGNLVHL